MNRRDVQFGEGFRIVPVIDWRSLRVSGVLSDIKWDVVLFAGPLILSFGLKVRIVSHTHEMEPQS